MKKHAVYTIFVFLYIGIISIPLILPYFHNGYFPTHDGEWAVVRLADMFRELKDHQFPPRYSGNLNFGYGYPLFNFAYPFPYYLGIVLHFLRINFVDSIKLLFAISVPLSGLGMFFASRLLWKNTIAGIISATLFLYLPYRLVDLYVRGSIGESLAFIFFPIIFYCVIKILEGGKSQWIGFSALLYGCLMLTHNIMALYFSIFLVLFLLGKLYISQSKHIIKVLLSMCLGLAISAFFWVPALLEKHFILLSVTPIADRNINFVSFMQLIVPSWGFGVPGGVRGFSFQFGIAQIIAGIIGILLFLFAIIKNNKLLEKKSVENAGIIIGIFCIFSLFLFPFSGIVWKLPLLSDINYPWTLLGPLGFLLALFSGIIAQKKYTQAIGGVICLLAFILVMPYAKPEYYLDRGDSFYITNDATTTSSHEYMPLWVKTIPFQRPEKKVQIIKGAGTIENITATSKEISFSAHLSENSYIRVNTIYYPGWTINKGDISYNNDLGVMEFWLTKGTHAIHMQFTETPLRIISNGVSLVSFIFVMLIVFQKYYIIKKLFFRAL